MYTSVYLIWPSIVVWAEPRSMHHVLGRPPQFLRLWIFLRMTGFLLEYLGIAPEQLWPRRRHLHPMLVRQEQAPRGDFLSKHLTLWIHPGLACLPACLLFRGVAGMTELRGFIPVVDSNICCRRLLVILSGLLRRFLPALSSGHHLVGGF